MKRFCIIKGLWVFFFVTSLTGPALKAQDKAYLKTSNGLRYIIHQATPNARKATPGDVLELNMIYSNARDSVLFDNRYNRQTFVHILEAPSYKADFNEALTLLGAGDSATFLLEAEPFYLKTLGYKTLPKFIKKGSELTFHVKCLNITPNDVYMKKQEETMAKSRAKAELAYKNEKGAIADYCLKNYITVEPANSGLYYISQREGNGPQPVEGNIAVVNYKGYLLNGKAFDSSYDKGNAFEFKIGGHTVIKGFEEAVRMMKKGGQAKVIVPSFLGYNENELENIPAFSTLVFEIELLDIK
jgi:FKBP-type peptidyl-prolyl cis-trans isomerase FkpA